MKRFTWNVTIGAGVMATALLVGGGAAATPRDGRDVPKAVGPAARAGLERLETEGGPVRAVFDARRGTVRSLRGRLGRVDARDETGLRRWVDERGAVLGVTGSDLALSALTTDRLGHTHATFRRLHRGLPVWGSDLTIHVDPAGVVAAITGRYEGALAIDDRPGVGEAAARETARRHPTSRGATKRADPGRLGVVSTGAGARLAYRVEVEGTAEEAWAVWVDAETGEVVDTEPMVMDATTPAEAQGVTGSGVSVALDAAFSEDHGAFVLTSWPEALAGARHETLDAGGHEAFDAVASYALPFVSLSGAFSDAAAVDAHVNVRRVLDWLWEEHGWRSWDGRGAPMTSLVHFGQQLNNAYWHAKLRTMMFGDGDGQLMTALSGCLDVAAHEMAHAVIHATVDLAYKGQAGALNEHVADAFGTFVDPPTGGAEDWLLGEDCMGPAAGRSFLRHMKRPMAGGQPAHFYDYLDLPETKDGDWGGVHVNSGIPNRAAALMIEALGVRDTARLYFQMLTGRYLPSRADFSDYRSGLLAACDSLWGDGSWACNRVVASLERVGIHAPGEAPSCPPGAENDAVSGCACGEGTVFDEVAWACRSSLSKACGGVPAMGECRGDVAATCEGGALVLTECGEGEACVYAASLETHVCDPVPAACADIPRGACDGDVLERCEGPERVATDCAADGRVCEETASGAACVAAAGCERSCVDRVCGGDGCGGICGVCEGGGACGEDGQCESRASDPGDEGDDPAAGGDGCAGGPPGAPPLWPGLVALGALGWRWRRRR